MDEYVAAFENVLACLNVEREVQNMHFQFVRWVAADPSVTWLGDFGKFFSQQIIL